MADGIPHSDASDEMSLHMAELGRRMRQRRTISLPPSLTADLRRHRARQYEQRLAFPGWWDHDLVFCHDDGRPYHRNTVRYRLKTLCERASVPVVSMIGLRRAATTWLTFLNVHPFVVQSRLGHQHVSMTRHYTDIDATQDRQAAAQLDSALFDVPDTDDQTAT